MFPDLFILCPRAVFCFGIAVCSLFCNGIVYYSVIELSSVHISQEITKKNKNIQKRDAIDKKLAEFANQRLKGGTKK